MPEKKRRFEIDEEDDKKRLPVSRNRKEDEEIDYSDPGNLTRKTDRQRSEEEADHYTQ